MHRRNIAELESFDTSIGENCKAITVAVTKFFQGRVLWFDAPVKLLKEPCGADDESVAGAKSATATKK